MKGFTIAIDGPVAAGKGTIASELATKLKGFYLYTGAMYRALALACINSNVSVKDPENALRILEENDIEVDEEKVFLNGEDVTERVKQQDTAQGASDVSVFPEIRKVMVEKQQKIAEKVVNKGKIVISEGRDTGTKVFPDSPLKIFLTASPTVRAKRRVEQFKELGREESFEQVLSEVKFRDKNDSERQTDPLVKEPDKFGYFVLDNSNLTEPQTIDIIIEEMKKRGLYDNN